MINKNMFNSTDQ